MNGWMNDLCSSQQLHLRPAGPNGPDWVRPRAAGRSPTLHSAARCCFAGELGEIHIVFLIVSIPTLHSGHMDAHSVDLTGQGRGGEAALIAISHCRVFNLPSRGDGAAPEN